MPGKYIHQDVSAEILGRLEQQFLHAQMLKEQKFHILIISLEEIHAYELIRLISLNI